MNKSPRIDNEALLAAGLEMMRQNGKPLSKAPSKGRSMLYTLPNGETVRARTCNDHILIVVASRPSADAELNIEGTDWLLVVMPEIERTPGKVITYLIPSEEAAATARKAHQEWLATNPNTKGENTTWNLWFRSDAPLKANDFATKWSKYRLQGEAYTNKPAAADYSVEPNNSGGDVKSAVEAARRQIAKAANVSPEAVKITIDFSL